MHENPMRHKRIRLTFRFDAGCLVPYLAGVAINRGTLITWAFWAGVSTGAWAESSSMVVIRYDVNGRPVVQESVETMSVETPKASTMHSVASKIDAQNRIAIERESTVVTTQPSPRVRKSESSTQVRDTSGKVKIRSKAVTTETQIASDTTKTETEFMETRSEEMRTTGRMTEIRKEKSDGSEYQRVFETRTAEGTFRPKQKVESQTTEYSSGASRSKTMESAYDLNGNCRPTQETVERVSAEFWGRQSIERIIKKIAAGGDVKLDRIELEEKHLRATSGVLNELVVKKPDGTYGLRDAKIVTTTAASNSTGHPYKITVTKEYPLNDKLAPPTVTEVLIEKPVQRSDGTTYVEREWKVRDVNGNLKTMTVTQIETKGDAPKPDRSETAAPPEPPIDSAAN